MADQQFTRDDVLSMMRDLTLKDNTRIAFQKAERPFGVQEINLDLSTAVLRTAPYKIGFPFKSLYAQNATDVNATVSVILGTNDTLQSAFELKQNSSIEVDYPISEAYLFWSAQPGKTMKLIAFVDANFRSGSQISVTGGGVSIVDGSTFSTARVDLAAATATQVVASDSTRKKASIQNNTGADVWFGGSSVSGSGANLGVKVSAGSILYWSNTAALYAYSTAGGSGDSGLLVVSEG